MDGQKMGLKQHEGEYMKTDFHFWMNQPFKTLNKRYMTVKVIWM